MSTSDNSSFFKQIDGAYQLFKKFNPEFAAYYASSKAREEANLKIMSEWIIQNLPAGINDACKPGAYDLAFRATKSRLAMDHAAHSKDLLNRLAERVKGMSSAEIKTAIQKEPGFADLYSKLNDREVGLDTAGRIYGK